MAFELIEELLGAAFALAGLIEAVQERALLGVDELGARAVRPDLGGGERNRDAGLVQMHLVGGDDALAFDNVPDRGVIRMDDAARRAARHALFAADPEVELVVGLLPSLGAYKPLRLGSRIG